MLQEASVGVAIRTVRGTSVAGFADFAISEFRYVSVLFVGRGMVRAWLPMFLLSWLHPVITCLKALPICYCLPFQVLAATAVRSWSLEFHEGVESHIVDIFQKHFVGFSR